MTVVSLSVIKTNPDLWCPDLYHPIHSRRLSDLNLQSMMSVLMTTISYQVGTNPDLQYLDLFQPIQSRRRSVDLNLQSAMSFLRAANCTISYQVGWSRD